MSKTEYRIYQLPITGKYFTYFLEFKSTYKTWYGFGQPKECWRRVPSEAEVFMSKKDTEDSCSFHAYSYKGLSFTSELAAKDFAKKWPNINDYLEHTKKTAKQPDTEEFTYL